MRNRGWVLLEVLWSVIIMTALAGVLALAARRDSIGLAHLSDSRASARVAESVLTAMQFGRTPPAADDAKVSVKQLATPSEAAGMVWVEVTAEISKRSATLVGLVPQDSIAGASPSTPAKPTTQPAGGQP